MLPYKQVLETVELALNRGEYQFCINYLTPLIKSFPISSKEGDNLRTIMITALCGVNKKEEAKNICKELLKSSDRKTQENTKYLMEIIYSPEIKKPENWNIKFENNINSNKKNSFNSLKQKKIKESKKFINTSNIPTGETKPFKKGFIFVLFFLIILLIPLLSGCVKVENTLDLSNVESINNVFKVESKYLKKYPWQLNFERNILDIVPNSDISKGENNFSIKNKNLNFATARGIIYKIQKLAGELAGSSTDLQIYFIEKDFFLLKKYNYKIDLDLRTLQEVDDLELIFNIISPNKSIIKNQNNTQIEANDNLIKWSLIPGELNKLEFSFWKWNNLLIGILFITLIMFMAYLIRFYRYQIGSDLPELPSN